MVVEEIVQKKFRVTIPADMRRKLRIREGDKVYVSLEGARVIIEPCWLIKNPTEKLASLGSPKKTVTAPEELEKKIREYRTRRKQL
ncbi:AbrB/MazE/SpoVT family DNA-binding domain-containing protein [Candidatus Bathyarchaeota archaeon]|nr:AbrB/MazE/SpoVT family DNA-binding domain-containing protein [Candidatus Bathyarchaeota archaeon]